jgi:hypothetical protein
VIRTDLVLAGRVTHPEIVPHTAAMPRFLYLEGRSLYLEGRLDPSQRDNRGTKAKGLGDFTDNFERQVCLPIGDIFRVSCDELNEIPGERFNT